MFRRSVGRLAVLGLVASLAACTGGSPHGEESGGEGAGGGRERTYYVAAEEVVWDYAPDGKDQTTGEKFSEDADVFVKRGKDRIGSKYKKCIYRGYTDDSFKERTPRPPSEDYQGFLGPAIRAEVGDTIKVVFKNNCEIPTSMHPHGVFYDKASEGADYADGSEGEKKGGAVEPGDSHTYNWEVPERAGPAEMDGSSAMWMYHSHADEVGDVYAGLSGFMVVTARGKAKEDGSPNDVDREVFSLFEVVDENSSPYIDANIKARTRSPKLDPEDEDFNESNLMHSINGFVYGNGPTATMKKGERVRWYLMGMGTEVDMHTAHWHGNTATINGMRSDVATLLPASMSTANLQPDAPGTWLFHCHVADHISAGMVARYKVTE